jgi:hypothetical protein
MSPAAQYLTPFDQALQVVTAALLHSELVAAVYAVCGAADGGRRHMGARLMSGIRIAGVGTQLCVRTHAPAGRRGNVSI